MPHNTINDAGSTIRAVNPDEFEWEGYEDLEVCFTDYQTFHVRPAWAAKYPGDATVDRVTLHINGACILSLGHLEGESFAGIEQALEEHKLAREIVLTAGDEPAISFLVTFLYGLKTPRIPVRIPVRIKVAQDAA